MVNEKEVGARIKKARKMRSLSQRELADIHHIENVDTIRRIENGKVGIGLATVIWVSEALHVSLDYLVKGEPRPDEDILRISVPLF